MRKKYKSKSWEEKKEQVNEVVKKMDEAIDNHFTSTKQMKEYLGFMSKFYGYSPRMQVFLTNLKQILNQETQLL